MELKSLFGPIKIGDMNLKNRIVMAPMGTGMATPEGCITSQMMDYYAERAKGGAGLITTEVTCVDAPLGKVGPWQPIIDEDKYMSEFRRLAEVIHQGGAKACLQLGHAGRYAFSFVIGAQSVAPSPILSRYTRETPRELTTQEVEEIIDKFGDAALRAKQAGFDAVELMGCTGYLISQFASPLTNKRTDRFGGDTTSRATFACEIISNIRKKVGNTFPISFKHSVDEFIPGGTTVEDSRVIVKEVEKAGASVIHAWAGWHESPKPMLPMSVPRGAFVYLAEAVKEVVSIPVVTVGRINDPKLADKIIQEGKADLVAFGRAFLADPHFPEKAAQERFDDIRKCIACCRCFDSLMQASPPVVCAVNAELGREGQNLVRPAEREKRILIIGGGPAGMEAARVAKLRGHDVTLWDKKGKLGGNLILAEKAPHKEEIANLTHYLIHQLQNLEVEVELSKEVTPEEVIQANADEVILATGSLPIVPEIPGVEKANVVTAIDVLSGREIKGKNILVVGGGMVGCEVAEFLEQQGKKVTIVEMLDRIAKDIGPTTAWVVRHRIKEKGIAIFTGTKLVGIGDDGITVEKEGKRESLKGDAVVLAMGLKPDSELMESLQGKVSLHYAGDCVEVAKILEAIHGGFKVGCEV